MDYDEYRHRKLNEMFTRVHIEAYLAKKRLEEGNENRCREWLSKGFQRIIDYENEFDGLPTLKKFPELTEESHEVIDYLWKILSDVEKQMLEGGK